MFALVERRRSRAALHFGLAGLIAAAAAGCSADVGRFTDAQFSGPNASRGATPSGYTGSAPQAQTMPVARVETQQLPAPPLRGSTEMAPARSDVTGSLPPPAAPATQANWHWEGGTAITVNPGDTIGTLSHRYGVPASAIMQANNIRAPASIQPGQRLVIPRYTYNGGSTRGAPHTPRVASNATIMPMPVGATGAVKPQPPTAGGVHVVAPGESLISIARLYHRPRKVIAKANSLTPDAKLRIGQHIAIPGAKPPVPPTIVASLPSKPAAPAIRRTEAGAAAKGQGAATPPTPTANGKIATAPVANARVAAPAAEPNIEQTSAVTPAETSGAPPSFRWPVRGRIIAGFGPKTNGQQNDGINLSVPEGTSVKAAEDGVVAYAGNELKGYGNLILVRHSNGFVTAYAHASELMVKRGDPVKRGQVIARAGQTGSVTSPQLHFEIRKGAAPVDPTQYLSGT
jgi:murein DD-endopeptidase MepM/ murein hydrolase activator NlpD